MNQRVTWSYTNGCDAVPVNDGDRIGWVTFVSGNAEACALYPYFSRAYWLTMFLTFSEGSEASIDGLLPRR